MSEQTTTELLVRFPLSGIADLYHFRFEWVEPALDDALMESNNGICDYAFCDETHLNMVPYAQDVEAALQTILSVLQQQEANPESIWVSQKGVPQKQIWP